MPEAVFGLAALTSDGCLVHCDLKKVCIYNINLYRQSKDLLKMLAFNFDSIPNH